MSWIHRLSKPVLITPLFPIQVDHGTLKVLNTAFYWVAYRKLGSWIIAQVFDDVFNRAIKKSRIDQIEFTYRRKFKNLNIIKISSFEKLSPSILTKIKVDLT
jgi:hypothetical protein